MKLHLDDSASLLFGSLAVSFLAGCAATAPPAPISSLSPLASLASLPSPTALAAPAQDDEFDPGIYVKAYGGAGFLSDTTFDFTGQGGPNSSADASFDAGFLAGGAVGYAFTDNWSAELDYAYRSNDVSSVRVNGQTVANGGDYASTSLMLNGFYRFDTDWRVRPYVGAGIGFATEIDVDLEGGPSNGGWSGTAPAAQLMVGGEANLTDSLRAFAELRYFRAFNPSMDAEEGGAVGTIDADYDHLGLLLGVNYKF